MATALQRIKRDVVEGQGHNILPIGIAGNELAWKFFELGNLRGKTAAQIIAAVGSPTFRSAMANGQTLLRWQARGYHMALVFDAENRVMKINAQPALVARRY